MITFIPRDIGLWRGVYHFGPESLSDKPTKSYFENKQEFISFLKEHGIKVNDAQNPLRFIGPREHDVLGSVYDVVQWSLLGWMKDESDERTN